MDRRYVGIDLHRRRSVIYAMDAEGEKLFCQRIDPALKTHGVITEEEIALRHAAHHDPSFTFTYSAYAAWGRRPQKDSTRT